MLEISMDISKKPYALQGGFMIPIELGNVSDGGRFTFGRP